MCFEMYMLHKRGIAADVMTSSTLCAIIWTTQAIISALFFIEWQISGKFFNYLNEVVLHQRGRYIADGSKNLKGESSTYTFSATEIMLSSEASVALSAACFTF
ncbi:hypothetical protein OESDEN_24656 [Oesophagostomum dentatum]|uniref:Uncharacterized protein n=1 Tax=Oesophagostomum dentatum TaxID=61180 RepID=A0A0B1RRQ6_OESDE|nr:hypothetical protein OESDEN_24656 [Oesophagostomum dentatum]